MRIPNLTWVIALLVVACHINNESREDYFTLEADNSLTTFGTVDVLMADTSGKILDTLFHGFLTSLEPLKKLSAKEYPKEPVRIIIRGYRDGNLEFEEYRVFDPDSNKVVSGSLKLDFDKAPTKVLVSEDTLKLTAGGPAKALTATVSPDYANPEVVWKIGDTTVARMTPDGKGNATIKPLRKGNTLAWVASAGDAGTADTVALRIDYAPVDSVVASDEEVRFKPGSTGKYIAYQVHPSLADPGVKWESRDPEIATVDKDGKVVPGKLGVTGIVVHSVADPGKADTIGIKVLAPITLSGIPAETTLVTQDSLALRIQVTGTFDKLVRLLLDGNGDGTWDDTLKGGTNSGEYRVGRKFTAEGDYVAAFRAEDEAGESLEAKCRITVRKSPDASLSELSFSSGVLTPAFKPDVQTYAMTVKYEVDKLGMTAQTTHPGAQISFNLEPLRSGGQFPPIVLLVGENSLNLQVQAQDGTQSQYTVTVTRLPSTEAGLSDLLVSAGKLSPAFSSQVTEYRDTLGYLDESIKITPVVKLSGSKVTVKDSLVQSGTASQAIPVALNGTAVVKVVVTAPDNKTTTVYTLTVYRQQSPVAELTGLSLSAGTLTPPFSPATLAYNARIPDSLTQVRVKVKKQSPDATVRVNGTVLETSEESFPVPIAVGSNNVTVVVISQNGANTKTFTIKVNRGGWVPVGPAVGISTGEASSVALSIDGATPYVAFQDEGLGAGKMGVLQFNGTSWAHVGTAGTLTASPPITLVVRNGVAYANAYYSSSNTNSLYSNSTSTWATIQNCSSSNMPMAFDVNPTASYYLAHYSNGGGGKMSCNSSYVFGGQISFLSLKTDLGKVYLIYREASIGGKAVALSHRGTTVFDTLGQYGFSPGGVSYLSAVVSGGTPYAAFQDAMRGNKVSVMKFNGNKWDSVGTMGFSAGIAAYTSLAEYNGTPVLAYQDLAANGRVTVKKFNGSAWETLGMEGFSPGASTYVALAIGSNGIPMVAFRDESIGGKALVYKYYDGN